MKTIQLKKDADRRIKAGHLWIFSNDIDTSKTPLKNYTIGEIIQIENHMGNPLAIGYINPHCLLCIRILTTHVFTKINTEFFIQRFQIAQQKRENYFKEKYYRVVFGESDRLPGVVIDQFNHIIVIQINTAGMENLKDFIIEAVLQVFQPEIMLLKCDSTERQNEGLESYTQIVKGELPEYIEVKENNFTYQISLLKAQKTGWFFDHRFNREKVASYCKDKKVLDVFSYCGAFTLPAAKVATHVTAIDRSQMALDLLTQNATLNGLKNIRTLCGDALASLNELNDKFDVIILDPPALIKRKKDLAAGEKMYQKLNEAALKCLNPNGILFTASCSMHLGSTDLLNVIRKAAIATKKEISVLEQCHQGLDHPIHPAIAETNYLKGFIISVM